MPSIFSLCPSLWFFEMAIHFLCYLYVRSIRFAFWFHMSFIIRRLLFSDETLDFRTMLKLKDYGDLRSWTKYLSHYIWYDHEHRRASQSNVDWIEKFLIGLCLNTCSPASDTIWVCSKLWHCWRKFVTCRRL